MMENTMITVFVLKVRFLQEQARKVLEDARLNALLHKTACNFKKVPGKTYYVSASAIYVKTLAIRPS